MAANQHFRTAFRGFNREDVVHYIEYLNNHYTRQLDDLSTQLQAAQAASAAANSADLEAKLQEALARCAQLEAQLAEQKTSEPVAVHSPTEEELEAYRRAERTERQARERAEQIYTQANAILAEVTTKAETASAQVASAVDQVTTTLQGTKTAFEDAVAALYTIRPEV